MRPIAALAAVALTIWTAQGQSGQPPFRDQRPFQSAIEVTTIAATVFNKDGEIVTGLGRDAFEVYEDGVRQTITQFTNERVPIGLGVLIDTSDSMFGKRIQDAREAVDKFLFELLADTDEFFILSFNHQPHILTNWTNAPEIVRSALAAIKPWGGTAVYDAVMRALPLVDNRTRARAALLIISDGADTASDTPLRDVRAALLRSDAFVYAIAIDPPERQAINHSVNAQALRDLTGESGGRTEVIASSEELSAAAERIANELNHQYVLGYTSAKGADGQYHTIRVRVGGGEYRVRARQGYVATPLAKRRRDG
jgi:Ca-activated chloride channel family protein